MVYIIDDWDDGLLSGRPVALTVINGSLFAKGEVLKAKRPEWSVNSGVADLSAGTLKVQTATLEVQTVSTKMVGMWEVTVTRNSGDRARLFFIIDYTIPDTYYFIGISAFDKYSMYKVFTGSYYELISDDYFGAGTYRMSVSRDSSGNFEIFIDGVSRGTTTDTDIVRSDYLRLRSEDVGVEFDDLVVY